MHRIAQQKWGERVRDDIEAALQGAARDGAPPVEAHFMDPEGDSSRQIEMLERCLRERFDAVIVIPIDPRAARPVLEKLKRGNVPVIVAQNDVEDPDLVASRILGHQRQFGQRIGEFFVRATDGEARLVEITGPATSSITKDRSHGFRDALAAHQGMQVVDVCDGEWLYRKALEEFERVLARQPALDGVFAHNDEMAAAALDAADRRGRADELLVVGIDALPSAIKLVSQGRQAATFLYPSPGKDAVYVVLALFNGEPCMRRIFLHTWPYESAARIAAWRARREAKGRTPAPRTSR